MDGGVGDEEAALSDFEEDDLEAAPVVLPPLVAPAPAQDSIAESLKSALADLEDERHARKVAEAAKADADSATTRLKAMIHEAIRQRDEALRQKDEALMAKEERSKQLEEALQLKEDVARQRDEVSVQKEECQKQRDDISRARDSAKAEIEGVARILVTQAEKVMSMSNGIKSFSGGLPRVPKSTGLAAIALGFSKRVEEVVEEVLKQREDAMQQRNELQVQMEQRNFSIAIEVSQLEASITQLKEEVGKKSAELEKWQKLSSGKDDKIADQKRAMLEQLDAVKQEAEQLKQKVEEGNIRLQTMSSETTRNIECAAQAKTHLLEILGLIHPETSLVPIQREPEDSSEGETESKQNGFLAVGQEIVDLAGKVVALWDENRQKAERERKDFESTVKLLHAEKGNILQKLIFPDHGSDSPGQFDQGSTEDTRNSELVDGTNSSHDAADVALEDSTERYQIIGEGPQQASLKLLQSELAAHETKNEQTSAKIALLEQNIEQLQQELKRTISSARFEIDRLQQQLATHARDLAGKAAGIFELEKHVESLTGDLLAAEEEVVRWKEAATAEAAAGAGILEEVEARNKEVATLNERVAKFRELMEEANSKVGSKEDMAMAAIAALNAAERSRQIADERAADLRYRIDEMNRQLEELEQKSERRGCGGIFDMCWPWLRGRSGRTGEDAQLSAEMEELLEPLV